jgi:protein-S-isoprenylcysteine O-methyltransferase Ste14
MKTGRSFIKKKRILISRLFVAALTILVLFSTSRWENIGLWSTAFFLVGVLLVGIATVGRIWCSLYIAGYKTNTLITTGPYSICRNPLYLFSFIGAVGVGLATETLTIPLALIIAFAIYYPLVIKREEQRLRDVHKDEYDNYYRATPSFFPSLKSFKESLEYTVKPKKFRKSLFDATLFVWLVGILELIEALHESGILPVLIKIY